MTDNIRNLGKADIVLVGISRTSKTPLSTYLAQRGYKVANVPLVMGIEPPKELFTIDQDKIFALSIDSQALFRIRQSRLPEPRHARRHGLWCTRSYR